MIYGNCHVSRRGVTNIFREGRGDRCGCTVEDMVERAEERRLSDLEKRVEGDAFIDEVKRLGLLLY